MPTPEEIEAAKVLEASLRKRGGTLPQQLAVKLVDAQHVYTNKQGKPALNAGVLEAFASLTPDTVWSQSRRHWRPRRPTDPDGRNAR